MDGDFVPHVFPLIKGQEESSMFRSFSKSKKLQQKYEILDFKCPIELNYNLESNEVNCFTHRYFWKNVHFNVGKYPSLFCTRKNYSHFSR